MNRQFLLAAIRAAWSPETTDAWHPEEPGRHHCGVSALVIQDYLGGDIVRNRIGDRIVWFVVLDDGTEVFHEAFYAGRPRKWPSGQLQTRETVMRHPDMPRRYALLSARVAAALLPDVR